MHMQHTCRKASASVGGHSYAQEGHKKSHDANNADWPLNPHWSVCHPATEVARDQYT